MFKIALLFSVSFFILTSCGESTAVTDCKIHYCDIQELEKRSANGEDVQAELLEKYSFLDATIASAKEEGYSDIDEILKAHKCE